MFQRLLNKQKARDKKWRKFWLRALSNDQSIISFVLDEYNAKTQLREGKVK